VKTLVIAAVSGLVLAAGGSVTAMAGSSTTAAGPGTCTDGHLWTGTGSVAGANVEGRPIGFRAGDKEGLYIWHDCDGWHLRTTDPKLPDSNPVHIYSGVVTTSGKFSTVKAFRLEKEDSLSQGSPSSFEYAFKTYHFKDGVDWRTAGSTLTFDVSKSPDKDFIVYLGEEKAVPTTNVFSFVLTDVGGQVSREASGSEASERGATSGARVRAPHFSAAAAPGERRGSALHLPPLNRRHV